MMTQRKQHACLAAVAVALTTAAVSADWMVFYLQPEGSPGSGGSATFQGQHVGYVRVGGPSCYDATPHAALWDGMSTEWIDLHPVSARVNDVSNDEPSCLAPIAPPLSLF